MKIKICGVTRMEDLMAIQVWPVWAVGFNCFEGSPRYVSPIQIQSLCAATQSDIVKVGVFVNASTQHVNEIRTLCYLDLVQLHGDETPAQCQALGPGIIKAFRLKAGQPLPNFADYAPFVDYFLLDAYQEDAYGGTGQRIDQGLLSHLQLPKPWLLAGGINPINAQAAWADHQPFALDICSGVESTPGIKDSACIKQLFSS